MDNNDIGLQTSARQILFEFVENEVEKWRRYTHFMLM